MASLITFIHENLSVTSVQTLYITKCVFYYIILLVEIRNLIDVSHMLR